MNLLRQLLIIFACLALGEAFVRVLHLQFPAAIVGMLILTAGLQLKVIKLHWVKPATDLLLANITFFFVPTCVSIILYLDLLSEHWWRLVIAVVASTALVMALTGWDYQLFARFCGSGKSPSSEHNSAAHDDEKLS